IVIAVDVSNVKVNTEITSIFDVIMQSIDIMQMELVANREVASDIMIRPRVEMYNSRAFTNIEEIIAMGEEEARKHIDKVKQCIEHWKESQSE
ncbi:MAG TPA: esterase, partial [Bacillus bacterium]|nr:esterase [Bacillus sp. (in: firmicutes)]